MEKINRNDSFESKNLNKLAPEVMQARNNTKLKVESILGNTELLEAKNSLREQILTILDNEKVKNYTNYTKYRIAKILQEETVLSPSELAQLNHQVEDKLTVAQVLEEAAQTEWRRKPVNEDLYRAAMPQATNDDVYAKAAMPQAANDDVYAKAA